MMETYGVKWDRKNVPPLDPDFVPLGAFCDGYLKKAGVKTAVAVWRNGGQVSVWETAIHGTPDMREADRFYLTRLVKFLLWSRGGWRVDICSDGEAAKEIARELKEMYREGGARAFDAKTMTEIYEQPFTVNFLPYGDKPEERSHSLPLGGHTDGCRIGFDAGGSNRKVSAVVDGRVVYSGQLPWQPKTQADPAYHYEKIVEAFQAAADKMPRVDAIGISSAGVFVDNQARIASLFLEVSPERFDNEIRNIYQRACSAIGENIPFAVANDGDVTALIGAMQVKDNGVLGISMGTSQAGGYVDPQGNITGWLNELAFVPVDGQPNGALDPWSGDRGCGSQYFSQDAVLRLAPKAGITVSNELTLAQKVREIQKLAEAGHEHAMAVFETIGCYLAHTLPFYQRFYNIKYAMLLGGVLRGAGGDILVESCRRVLREEYPDCGLTIVLPDEKSRCVGQSVAAAGLPVIVK